MKIKPRISKRVVQRVRKMFLIAAAMGIAAYVGEYYVKVPTSSYMASDASNYSGLYVNADVLGEEGER